jgi:peptide chain release factor 1
MMGNMDDMLDALNVYAKEEQLKADVSALEG